MRFFGYVFVASSAPGPGTGLFNEHHVTRSGIAITSSNCRTQQLQAVTDQERYVPTATPIVNTATQKPVAH